MNQAVVGIGSNTDREQNICKVLDCLLDQFTTLSVSPVYESVSDKLSVSGSLPVYYNLVVAFETELTLVELKQHLRTLENQCHRQRTSIDVTIDLDILLFNDWAGEFEGNRVPHADIETCAYVLRPLADLAPERCHPILKTSFRQLWSTSDLSQKVKPVDFVWQGKLISMNPACTNL